MAATSQAEFRLGLSASHRMFKRNVFWIFNVFSVALNFLFPWQMGRRGPQTEIVPRTIIKDIEGETLQSSHSMNALYISSPSSTPRLDPFLTDGQILDALVRLHAFAQPPTLPRIEHESIHSDPARQPPFDAEADRSRRRHQRRILLYPPLITRLRLFLCGALVWSIPPGALVCFFRVVVFAVCGVKGQAVGSILVIVRERSHGRTAQGRIAGRSCISSRHPPFNDIVSRGKESFTAAGA